MSTHSTDPISVAVAVVSLHSVLHLRIRLGLRYLVFTKLFYPHSILVPSVTIYNIIYLWNLLSSQRITESSMYFNRKYLTKHKLWKTGNSFKCHEFFYYSFLLMRIRINSVMHSMIVRYIVLDVCVLKNHKNYLWKKFINYFAYQ